MTDLLYGTDYSEERYVNQINNKYQISLASHMFGYDYLTFHALFIASNDSLNSSWDSVDQNNKNHPLQGFLNIPIEKLTRDQLYLLSIYYDIFESNYEKSREYLTLAANKLHEYALIDVGTIAFHQQQWEKMIDSYTLVCQHYNNPVIMKKLAMFYQSINDPISARHWFEQVTENTEDADSLWAMIQYTYQEHNYDSLVEFIPRYLQCFPYSEFELRIQLQRSIPQFDILVRLWKKPQKTNSEYLELITCLEKNQAYPSLIDSMYQQCCEQGCVASMIYRIIYISEAILTQNWVGQKIIQARKERSMNRLIEGLIELLLDFEKTTDITLYSFGFVCISLFYTYSNTARNISNFKKVFASILKQQEYVGKSSSIALDTELDFYVRHNSPQELNLICYRYFLEQKNDKRKAISFGMLYLRVTLSLLKVDRVIDHILLQYKQEPKLLFEEISYNLNNLPNQQNYLKMFQQMLTHVEYKQCMETSVKDKECPICLDDDKRMTTYTCGHEICLSCYYQTKQCCYYRCNQDKKPSKRRRII